MLPLRAQFLQRQYPFHETRVYVKNVMSNASYYSGVMSGQTISLKQRLGTITPKAAIQSELP